MDVKRIQNRLTEMGYTIAQILEKNNIPYMITFGTLLGAVRHKGFIPWDDDFDLFLFDETYGKAIDVLRKELPQDMFVEDEKSEPLYFHGWAHVKDLNSETVCDEYPQDSLYSHHGLSVDLYIAKKIKESELEHYVTDEHILYLRRKLKHGLISKNDFDERVKKLLEKLNTVKEIDSDKIIFGLNVPEKRMDYEDVFPLKKYNFDNRIFYGPSNADKILTQFYGDFMSLPPVESQRPHYSSVVFK